MRTYLSLFLLLTSLPLSAATFKVVNTADSGPGSLRQAMEDVNASTVCSPVNACTIEFAIPGPVPASGWFTISPLSPLPIIDRSPVTMNATTQSQVTGDTNPLGPEIELDGTHAGYRSGLKAFASYGLIIQGFAVNRFEGHGIFVDAGTNTTIVGNYVGVDPTGTVAMPNGFDGITLRAANSSRIAYNVVSGNRGNGIYVAGAIETSVDGNRVGLSAHGESPIPNGASGIDFRGIRSYVSSNTIAFNTLHGVGVSGEISVYANNIFNNGLLGIANWITNTPGAQIPAPPVITTAIENSQTEGFYTGFPVVKGTLRSTPNTDVFVNAYATPAPDALGRAEGKLFIGRTQVRTDEQGVANFVIERDYNEHVLDVFGGYVTATIQPYLGTTSEFSAPFPITVTTPTFEVTTTADAGPGSLRDAIARVNATTCGVHTPCRITFNIARDALTDGVATISLQAPLPAIRGYVRVSGASQTWWQGDSNGAGPDVEIRGGDGLHFGSAEAPVARAYLHSIVVNGSSADGITFNVSANEQTGNSQPRVMISEVFSGTDASGKVARPNAGSGMRIEGGEISTFVSQTNVSVRRSLLSGNRGHGLLLGGSLHAIYETRIGTDITGAAPLPNGMDGIHVTGGTQHSLNGNTIAFNTDDGVSSAAGVRMPAVDSVVHHNGGLGIDVHDDGVTPSDGNNDDGTLDPPTILSARYDPATNLTIVEGISNADTYPLSPTFGGAGDRFGHMFFYSSEPDPSGRGEGETPMPTVYPPLKFVEGSNGTFRLGIQRDLRGQWFTGTTNRFYCYWEFGCTARESSEFGVSVKVE